MKKICFPVIFIFAVFGGFSQGTESFTNIPTTTPTTYTARSWTGDNSLPWTAGNARTDGPAAASTVTGLTGAFIIVRNTTGIITCNNIPNGCGTISFKYAKAFTAAGNIPTFGLFINGTQYGATTTASSNAAGTFTVSPAVSGTFNLEIRQLTANDQARLAVDDISWTPSGGSACTSPAAQPTALTFSTVTATSVSGSFTAAAADGYLVVRSLSATLSANPADGTTYAAGSSLGGGTIVLSGAAATFTDNGLAANTTYYYFIFAFNNASCIGGPAYNTASPLTGNTVTSALANCTAPNPPGTLSLTPANNAVSGTFTASAPAAGQYLVVISTSSSLTASPQSGTVYMIGSSFGGGTVASYSGNTFFNIGGLTPATTYYFFVFAANTGCTGEPAYNPSSSFSSTTTTNNASGIPNGYYNAAAGLTCANLKDALSTIATNGQVTLSYGSLDDIQMPVADTIRSDDGARSIIWDIYTNNPAGPEPFEYNASQNPAGGFCGGSASGCWNKEHTFPQSWFGSVYPPEADLFIVRPTDITVNGKRGNIPYSIVGGSTTYTFPATTSTYPGVPILDKVGPSTAAGVTAGAAFEPAAGIKGDIARGYFYILTRYQSNLAGWVSANGASGIATVVDGTTNGGTYPSFQPGYLTMMYNWHVADPVDAREINFNNLVYTQQNNRNPYIDHPEYVAQVFQCTGLIPVTLIDFTAQKNNEAVLLKWYATQETGFNRYDLERSTDGIHFNKIEEIAGQNLGNYSFNDNDLPKSSVLYYRLKMIDLDAKFRYSKIASVRLNNNFSNALVYPNPVAGTLHIKLYDALQADSDLMITDIAGRIVKKQFANANISAIDLDVKSLPAGRYFIRIMNSMQVINESFVVVK